MEIRKPDATGFIFRQILLAGPELHFESAEGSKEALGGASNPTV